MMQISERQHEIIEAAGKILTQSGVSGLTIKNLAKEMCFTESAVYRHFSSKEEIIVALLNYLALSIEERCQLAVDSKLPPQEKFTKLFTGMLEFFNQNPHFVVAAFSDGLLEENERINEAYLKIFAIVMKSLMPVISEGQQKQIFTNKLTTEELIHIVMGAFRLQMFKWRMSNFQFDILRIGNNLIQSTLTLIKQDQ